MELRWAGGDPKRLPALAVELAQLKVDAIVTQGTQATDAARRAAKTLEARDVGQLDAGFAAAVQDQARAMIVLSDSVTATMLARADRVIQ